MKCCFTGFLIAPLLCSSQIDRISCSSAPICLGFFLFSFVKPPLSLTLESPLVRSFPFPKTWEHSDFLAGLRTGEACTCHHGMCREHHHSIYCRYSTSQGKNGKQLSINYWGNKDIVLWALECFLPLLSNKAFVKHQARSAVCGSCPEEEFAPVCDWGALCGIVNTHRAAQAVPSVCITQTAPQHTKRHQIIFVILFSSCWNIIFLFIYPFPYWV